MGVSRIFRTGNKDRSVNKSKYFRLVPGGGSSQILVPSQRSQLLRLPGTYIYVFLFVSQPSSLTKLEQRLIICIHMYSPYSPFLLAIYLAVLEIAWDYTND